MRMLAKVPRVITRSLPRRDPKLLKSRGDSCSWRYRPAGPSGLIAPAGEMWSVVTESPKAAEPAPRIGWIGPGSAARSIRNGGSWI